MSFRINSEFNNAIISELKSLGLCNKQSLEGQTYTLNHKQAYLATQLAFRGQVSNSGILHDTDKLVIYGLCDKKQASKLHRMYARHHINIAKTDDDLYDCVIDYECARYTKPDKPLNAYNTVFKFCPDKYDILKPALIELGLDSKINRDANFTMWEQLKNNGIIDIIEANIIAIKSIYSDIEKFGVEMGLKNFYK